MRLYNLSNKMDNSLLAVKDINHKHIVVGGTLVFGCRSVYKDMTGKCVMDLLPANVFTERLSANGLQAKIEGIYTSEHFAGDGALVSNTYGEGKAYYYGTSFSVDSVKTFLTKLNVISPYESIISLPEGCESAVRTKNNKKYMFVLNYLKDVVEIQLHNTVVNLYTGKAISGKQ